MNLPNQVFCGNNTGRDSVPEGMEFNFLVALEVFLAKEHIEIGGLLD